MIDLSASSDSFDPTDTLLRVRLPPEFLWYLHLNEPTWVVGEQRQLLFLTLDVFRRLTGDVGTEEEDDVIIVVVLMLSMPRLEFDGTFRFDESAILNLEYIETESKSLLW
ncbi:UPF0301 protein AB57_0401 [Striga asiatica]|uniref:UPF0301 protein AB57_0401 n=1 Tax=Striga asiatica TaxID=4170 RepID=A0A5A7QTA5_STRAF|nr:UPF0301 protein AB57_0401 [Striga asiatica]